MKPASVRRIASQGLSEHEQGLLVQQLKMLRGRTEYQWTYVGEAGARDLTLSLREPQASEAQAQLEEGPNIRLEWPVRLFGLITLLQECEALIASRQPKAAISTAPVASLAVRLAALNEPSALLGEQGAFHFLPGDECIYSDLPDEKTAAQVLAAWPADAELQALTGLKPLPHEHGGKALLWRLALHEPAAATGLDTRAAYRIGAWPSFGMWHSSPALMRLAALFSRDHATLAQGAAFANVTADEVAAFLHACQCCGLGLQVKVQSPTVIAPPAPAAAPQGLLQRLRNRLGLGFRRD